MRRIPLALAALFLVTLPGASYGVGSSLTGKPAPNFKAATVDGEVFTLSSYKGKGVIINFWATWCGPCKAEMPDLNRMTAAHPNLAVLGVNYQQPHQAIARFAKRTEVSFPLLVDEEGLISTRYGVMGLPTSFFVDTQGIVVGVHVGVLNEARLAPWLEKMGID